MNLGDVEVKEEKLCKYKTKDRSKNFERERKTERETEEGCLHLHIGENWETQSAYPSPFLSTPSQCIQPHPPNPPPRLHPPVPIVCKNGLVSISYFLPLAQSIYIYIALSPFSFSLSLTHSLSLSLSLSLCLPSLSLLSSICMYHINYQITFYFTY